MVSIDGWVNIINSNAQLEGFSFEMHHDENGALIACTCTMKRKDRSLPTVVTEYLAECIRNTEPWKLKYRMLRHKALVQAARYCFGLSGIYDEDEASDQEMINITPGDAPPRPRIQDFVEETKTTETVNQETGEVTEEETATEFGASDAMEMGREQRRQNKPKKALPDWQAPDAETASTWTGAFEAGYDEIDIEITAEKRK